MSRITDLVRVGRWLLCRFWRCGLQCKRLITAGHKKESSSPAVPAREHVVDRGESRLVLLSTQPVILKPSYDEPLAPVRNLPPETTSTQLQTAIQNLHFVKIGSPAVFPVELYLRQLESTDGLSECIQSGTSSIRLALTLSGQAAVDEVSNNFVIHFARRPQPCKPIICDSICSRDARE